MAKAQVGVQIKDALLEDIDSICKQEGGLPRSRVIVELIRSGLEEYDWNADPSGMMLGFSSVRKRIGLFEEEKDNGSK